MKHLMQMPPPPGIDSISVQDVLSSFARTVGELSLQLHLYNAHAASQPSSRLQGPHHQQQQQQQGPHQQEPLQ
ncbi:hypothetical protein OEZ86_012614 [Tetradesmus obliquus]|nr:hypothetical protein OEZ86_012614 [Tetradesmus obliquus]